MGRSTHDDTVKTIMWLKRKKISLIASDCRKQSVRTHHLMIITGPLTLKDKVWAMDCPDTENTTGRMTWDRSGKRNQ